MASGYGNRAGAAMLRRHDDWSAMEHPLPARSPSDLLPELMHARSAVWRTAGRATLLDRPPPAVASHAPYKLLLALQGSTRVQQRRRCVTLEPGQFTLLDGACDVGLEASEFEHVLIALPRPLLTQHRSQIGREVLQLHGRRAEEALVRDFAQSLGRHAPGLAAPALARSLRTLAELLAAALDGQPAATVPALLQRAIALLDLEPGDIDAQTLAERLRVSRRYLDKTFAAHGQTATGLIREHRLALAGRLLRAQPLRTVTDICHAVGFQDASHFTRVFRQRFGCTPRAWRA
jgi:AraC-like DNA-binding protein